MNNIKYFYNSKSDTTMYQCNICKEWYYEDEVVSLDCNNCCTRDINVTESIHCLMCDDNN